MGSHEHVEEAKEAVASARKVLLLTGAGVSAESGVPTFRGGGTSTVWRGMPFEQLSSAEMVEKDLPLVWDWFEYRRGVVRECAPNAAHRAIVDAQTSGRFENFTLVTQNIDGLHRAAGSVELIELHGHIHDGRCLSCGTICPLDSLPAEERPPVCPECGDSMRPHVVLFGEGLDEDALLLAYEKAADCDVCIVVGTSALVYPAMHIPEIAKREGAFLIEVNLDETPFTPKADVSLFGKAGEILPLLLRT
jgi:NAD-dependent deacetylase